MRYRVSLAVMGSFLAIATVAKADQIGALLTGYEESPSVSTTASGEFTATVAPDGNSISYTESYSGLQAPVTQSRTTMAIVRVMIDRSSHIDLFSI